ncbi:MAG: ribulose-phosphate 3-epimerase [Eubacteriales bacterium]
MIKIAPSLLSSDFSRFGEEIARMDTCGADLMHLDVMDGHFVPNITFGAPIIKSIRKYSQIAFDVHLMISEPFKFIDDFAGAGADIITFNVEAQSPISATIEAIRAAGCSPSLCVKPATDIEEVFPYLDKIEMVLIMTVEPGFGGQSFITETLSKIELLRKVCVERKISMDIEVDGGISNETIVLAAKAGANIFVAGSAVFGAKNSEAAIMQLRSLASAAYK